MSSRWEERVWLVDVVDDDEQVIPYSTAVKCGKAENKAWDRYCSKPNTMMTLYLSSLDPRPGPLHAQCSADMIQRKV